MKRYMLVTLLMIFGCALDLRADDTEIYGTVNNPSLEPNVMVLFDTSGSMATEDVPGDPYDPSQTYTCGSCTIPTNAVYYRHWSQQRQLLLGPFRQQTSTTSPAPRIKNSLLTQGYADGYIRSSRAYTCGGQQLAAAAHSATT